MKHKVSRMNLYGLNNKYYKYLTLLHFSCFTLCQDLQANPVRFATQNVVAKCTHFCQDLQANPVRFATQNVVAKMWQEKCKSKESACVLQAKRSCKT